VASGGKWSGAKRLKQAKTVAVGCNRLRREAHGKEGGLRFESGRGLCKSAANRRFVFQLDLQNRQCAVGMGPFMELSVRRRPPVSVKNWPSSRRIVLRRRARRATTGPVPQGCSYVFGETDPLRLRRAKTVATLTPRLPRPSGKRLSGLHRVRLSGRMPPNENPHQRDQRRVDLRPWRSDAEVRQCWGMTPERVGRQPICSASPMRIPSGPRT
jgi:hypothetical protein